MALSFTEKLALIRQGHELKTSITAGSLSFMDRLAAIRQLAEVSQKLGVKTPTQQEQEQEQDNSGSRIQMGFEALPSSHPFHTKYPRWVNSAVLKEPLSAGEPVYLNRSKGFAITFAPKLGGGAINESDLSVILDPKVNPDYSGMAWPWNSSVNRSGAANQFIDSSMKKSMRSAAVTLKTRLEKEFPILVGEKLIELRKDEAMPYFVVDHAGQKFMPSTRTLTDAVEYAEKSYTLSDVVKRSSLLVALNSLPDEWSYQPLEGSDTARAFRMVDNRIFELSIKNAANGRLDMTVSSDGSTLLREITDSGSSNVNDFLGRFEDTLTTQNEEQEPENELLANYRKNEYSSLPLEEFKDMMVTVDEMGMNLSEIKAGAKAWLNDNSELITAAA